MFPNLTVAQSRAAHAVKAARMMRMSGVYAMARYAAKRGIPAELVILAMRLERAK